MSSKEELRIGDKVRITNNLDFRYAETGRVIYFRKESVGVEFKDGSKDQYSFNEVERTTYNNTFENPTNPKELTTEKAIELTLDNMKSLLIAKNRNYGDAAFKPRKIFYKGEQKNTIPQRLDEKLARIENSQELRKNDVADLIGYLTLLCIQNGWTNFNDLID